MGSAQEYLGQQIQNAGQQLAGLGVAVYKVDAETKYQEKSLEIAQRVEDFKRTLLTDPDAGTPGKGDGYLKKWDAFSKEIEKDLEKTENPLARQKTDQYWQQTKIEQGGQIADQQFNAWKGNTRASHFKQIQTMIETFGIPEQEKLEAAAGQLSYLKDNNLMTTGEYDEAIAGFSQTIIRKGMLERAKQEYETNGYAAARKLLAGDQQTYQVDGTQFTAGDQVKDLVKRDLEDFNDIVQDNRNAEATDLWSNIMNNATAVDGKKDRPILTYDWLESEKQMDAPTKKYWYDQLRGYYSSLGGSESANAEATRALSFIEAAYGRIKLAREQGMGDPANISIGNDDNGKPVYIVCTNEGVKAFIDEKLGVLAGKDGATRRTSEILADLGGAVSNEGKSYFGQAKEYIMTSYKDQADRSVNGQIQLDAWARDHPNATADDMIARAKSIVAEEKYKPMVSAAFNFTPGSKDSDDQIIFEQWDEKRQYQFGAGEGDSIVRPIAWQTKPNMESFAVGFIKTLKGLPGMKDVDLGMASWIPIRGKTGVMTYSTTKRKPDGGSETYLAVPVIYPSGDREAGIMRETVNKKGDVTKEVYNEESKEWKKVTDDGNLKKEGWSILTAGEAAKAQDDKIKADKAAKDAADAAIQKAAAASGGRMPGYYTPPGQIPVTPERTNIQSGRGR